MMHQAAIVLAAGSSSRFGADKRDAEVAGEPLLRRTVRTALAAYPEVVLVLRPGADPLLEGFAALAARTPALRIVQAERAAEGMGASLAAGAAALPHADALWVLLGDMPWLRRDTLRRLQAMLLRNLRRGSDGVVVRPRHRGCAGHPVGFPAALRPALIGLAGDAGARGLVARCRSEGRLQMLDVADPGVLLDVDRPQDLAVPAGVPGTETKPASDSVGSPRKR